MVCTVAFGRGVNCRNVNESIHFGAPKSIEAFVQESGRIGRNGQLSISRIIYNALLLRGADPQVKSFIHETQCRRQQLMKHFGHHVPKESNGCHCCDNCAKLCNCSQSCMAWTVMIWNNKVTDKTTRETRNVSPEQKKLLHELLNYRKKLVQDSNLSLVGAHTEFYSFNVN